MDPAYTKIPRPQIDELMLFGLHLDPEDPLLDNGFYMVEHMKPRDPSILMSNLYNPFAGIVVSWLRTSTDHPFPDIRFPEEWSGVVFPTYEYLINLDMFDPPQRIRYVIQTHIEDNPTTLTLIHQIILSDEDLRREYR